MAVLLPLIGFLCRFAAQAAMEGRIPAVGPRRRQLLLDSGRVLMMLAAGILTHQLGTNATASGGAEFMLPAFLLWLLGAALAMLSFVAQQFPRLAAAGAAVALALRNYLLGNL